jgi:heme O synthase-like polyprenyltransferase
VLLALIGGRLQSGWTWLFLVTTVLTSVTGYPLPPFGWDPARTVATISLVVLAIAIAAYALFHLGGAWRWIYVVTATIALYFNCFVGVAQAFDKTPFLRALAPTQDALAFKVAQIALLVLFVVLGFVAVTRTRAKA